VSPDIEWRVSEDNREETLVKTPSTAARRWRAGLIAVMIVLGASLGAVYVRIQEPAPLPTPVPTLRPTPIPTLAPPPLIETIDKESLALARGDRSAFMSVQDLSNADWYRSQQKNFETWGAPAGGSQPYEVLDSGSLADGTSLAEVYQYRNDLYFRETRFYRVVGGAWLRTAPDLSFWGGERELNTVHFRAVFANEDQELARYVLFRFEDAYERLCGDLNCPRQRQCIEGLIDNLVGCSSFPRVLTLTLVLSPTVTQARWLTDHAVQTITLPSPRISGIYNRWWSENDPILRTAYHSLITPIAQLASRNFDRWQSDLGGNWFLEAITAWELYRVETIEGEIQPELAQAFYADLLNGLILIPLDTTWTWHVDQDPGMGAGNDRGQIEAEAVIAYIDQTYGPAKVVEFLNVLGPARSTAEAVQAALNVKFAELNRAWLTWLGR
jgi:hypothetical protein